MNSFRSVAALHFRNDFVRSRERIGRPGYRASHDEIVRTGCNCRCGSCDAFLIAGVICRGTYSGCDDEKVVTWRRAADGFDFVW